MTLSRDLIVTNSALPLVADLQFISSSSTREVGLTMTEAPAADSREIQIPQTAERDLSPMATSKSGAELPVSVNTTEMVQYMVEKGLTQVPPEFVLPPKLRPSSTQVHVPSTFQIPVVDMADFQHEQGAERIFREIGRACEEWGFFQVLWTQ
jgi:hypothetical protein